MKKYLIIFFQLLAASWCYSQSIDTSALRILQRSWDNLNTMESIPYRMRLVDTMLRVDQLSVRWSNIRGTVKKNAYWHFKINNKLEWLVRGDTLYKKDGPHANALTFTTDWNRHKIGSLNIQDILGAHRPDLNDQLESLRFVQDTSVNDYYEIEAAYKRANEEIVQVENILHFTRYHINKKSLFTYRRMQYGKSRVDGEVQTDIYDFTASLDSTVGPFNSSLFFNVPLLNETNRLRALKPGSPAPPFKAINVRSGKAVSLPALKRKVVLLDFWYLSCLPCRALMPRLQKLQDKFGKENVVFIGINIRDTNPKAIIKFLDEQHIRYPHYYQTSQLLVWDYKLQAFPTTLVLGLDNKVKLVETGVSSDTELKLEQAIRKELTRGAHQQ